MALPPPIILRPGESATINLLPNMTYCALYYDKSATQLYRATSNTTLTNDSQNILFARFSFNRNNFPICINYGATITEIDEYRTNEVLYSSVISQEEGTSESSVMSQKAVGDSIKLSKYNTYSLLSQIYQGKLSNTPSELFNLADTYGWYTKDSVVLDENDNVEQWNDVIGSGNSLVSPDEKNRPIYNNGVISTDGFWTKLYTLNETLGNKLTVYMAINPKTNGCILDGFDTSVQTLFIDRVMDNFVKFNSRNGNLTTRSIGLNELMIIAFRIDGSSVSVKLNCFEIQSGTCTDSVFKYITFFGLQKNNLSLSPLKSDVHEIIIRNIADTDSVLNKFSEYLCEKYGVYEYKEDKQKFLNIEKITPKSKELIENKELDGDFVDGLCPVFTKTGNPIISKETSDVVSGNAQSFTATASGDALRVTIPLQGGTPIKVSIVAKRISGTTGTTIFSTQNMQQPNQAIISDEYKTYEVYGYHHSGLTWEQGAFFEIKETEDGEHDTILIDSVSCEVMNRFSVLSHPYTLRNTDFQIICKLNLVKNAYLGFLFCCDSKYSPSVGFQAVFNDTIFSYGRFNGTFAPYKTTIRAITSDDVITLRKKGNKLLYIKNYAQQGDSYSMTTLSETELLNRTLYLVSLSEENSIEEVEVLDKKKNITFIGDSITAQIDGWSFIVPVMYDKNGYFLDAKVRAEFGAVIVPQGESHTMEELVGRTVDDNPDVIIVALGVNNAANTDVEEVYRTQINRLRTIHPSAPIYCHGVLDNQSLTGENLEARNAQIQQAITNVSNCYYVNTKGWINPVIGEDLADAVHPNFNGHKKLQEM